MGIMQDLMEKRSNNNPAHWFILRWSRSLQNGMFVLAGSFFFELDQNSPTEPIVRRKIAMPFQGQFGTDLKIAW